MTASPNSAHPLSAETSRQSQAISAGRVELGLNPDSLGMIAPSTERDSHPSPPPPVHIRRRQADLILLIVNIICAVVVGVCVTAAGVAGVAIWTR